jgi:hypothetical protein
MAVNDSKQNQAGIAFPDVCKTPVAAGPIPVPYPNFLPMKAAEGMQTKVKLKSPYQKTAGDEAGVSRGVVSSTFKSENTYRTKVLGAPVNAVPSVKCGNPNCGLSSGPGLPSDQTATLPRGVKVDFPGRLVCKRCYLDIVGSQPRPQN